VSELTGIKYKHIWIYKKRGVFPEPDDYIGNKPLWKKETIEAWDNTRRRWAKNKPTEEAEV
jgi:predicted DNA-binding transcriptional regulator AlpA